MTRRVALTVVLAAMLLLAGCSQLATAPNEAGETTTVESNATTTDVTETAQTATATRAPTPTIQGQVATTTASSTPTATATPSPTATATSTATATPTPTAAATPTTTDTQTSTGEAKYVVIIGGEPDEKVNYRMTVTGSIERRGQSYGAPIDDSGVTQDPDLDIISGSTVAGRLGGGGDAYRITGEITDFEGGDDVEVYVDGEETDVDSE
ncbi:hypothetical protein C448_13356 [Halococcus morrhuae DSM 1307]|uniref:Lipoprotein n=1 Tax=Halococcus morrhuae DSM 1307 TaxID=931277 RepID=M0M3Q4_HALMO|nr:hypothetical protein [Halococcus morrhuae]EMA40341.1 hypothetical protein C448_13356 [Halococcus morrhuae DSM 1307]